MQKTYVKIDSAPDLITAHLFGELDHHSVQALRQDIDSSVLQGKPQELILDFSGVNFMDSSGIGLVMGRYKLINELGGALRLIGLSKSTRKVMEVSGLNKLAKF